ncbi:amidase [Chelatococcus sp. SYSU_G07232]|uniref:Amidase n=1 Tax=Chelatococcus albus TaxID=3047466 RepID=A0ABT7AG59_9HYPH|nr:amidase [Chelatococcus sp. SYSU_G07232]MDJ1158341.1 amidase [Chelatococcus sp. SYSU_G07232]
MHDDHLHAFMPYPEVPVAHAPEGPLAGLRLAVKDLYDVAGYPTSGGNPLMLVRSGIKQTTAPLVQQLLDAGARFVGKTVTDELAFAMNGKNAHFGTPVNAAAPERIPGGSSSGSASAVSGHLADIALGTDTGGSVRAPASYCGLFGIRPTHGRLSLDGCLPLAPSFDTAGFFARDAATFEAVAEVLLGDDPAPLTDEPALLVAEDLFARATPEAARVLKAALTRASLRLQDMRALEETVSGHEELYWTFRRLQGREAWEADGAFIERYAPPLGPGVAERFAYARGVTDAEVEEAGRVREVFRAHLGRLVNGGDVLVLPTVPDVAPLLSASEGALEDFRTQALHLLCLSGLSGFPQITVPVAMKDGAPLGLSLLGRPGCDRTLVGLALRLADAAAVRVA